jgi:1-acyl-sn-glycerol-3-phosphate acyltransferase
MKALTSLKKSMSVFTSTLSYLHRARDPSANIEELKMEWARETLTGIGARLVCRGNVSTEPSTLYLGNHISYLDIPLLLAFVPRLSFVSKKEIGNWPLFGSGARKINTIFVERNNPKNRRAARDSITRELHRGARIALFPSGTTTMDESTHWKRGAFEIAQELGAYVQPFRLRYTPLRRAAFIDEDIFPIHLYQLTNSRGITATIEFHEPVKIEDAVVDSIKWQNWARSSELSPEMATVKSPDLGLPLPADFSIGTSA